MLSHVRTRLPTLIFYFPSSLLFGRHIHDSADAGGQGVAPVGDRDAESLLDFGLVQDRETRPLRLGRIFLSVARPYVTVVSADLADRFRKIIPRDGTLVGIVVNSFHA